MAEEIAGSLVLGGNLWNSRESGEGVSGAARSHGVEGVIEGVRLEIESGRKGVLEDASQFFFEWDPKVMLETVGLRWDATFGRCLVSN